MDGNQSDPDGGTGLNPREPGADLSPMVHREPAPFGAAWEDEWDAQRAEEIAAWGEAHDSCLCFWCRLDRGDHADLPEVECLVGGKLRPKPIVRDRRTA